MADPIESEAQRLMREYEKDRTRCRCCGKWVKKTKNCRLRFHKREIAVGTFWRTEKCPASGQLPEQWSWK